MTSKKEFHINGRNKIFLKLNSHACITKYKEKEYFSIMIINKKNNNNNYNNTNAI